ncbi:ATP-binding protein [Shewanella glacialipiscicola]|uniref:ATP-binding protein n=1 Tax=Shewanella glacialipiscicola TaxID=614069 RepID=UPI003D7A593D
MFEVKPSAITYTGYEYQTLHGVKLLASWLNSPTRYKRIGFEVDDSDAAVPQGIDDIVCERQNLKRDYIQVKFTPNTDNNLLSWEWLLKKSGKTERSRTLLQKFSDAIDEISVENTESVILLTNKIPERDVECALKANKIIYDLIPIETQNKIVVQLGNEERARLLFSILVVCHSDLSYKTLLIDIEESLRKLTDEAGVHRLINKSRDWSKFKDQPTEGGWITLEDIRGVISTKRPEPIPQSFIIPEHYVLPDEDFHQYFLQKIIQIKSNIHVITGSPGKGKSTYLSYLCDQLKEHKIQYVRHHYFLSLDDRTNDRLSPRVVSEDLITQITSKYDVGDLDNYNSESLNLALQKCGEINKINKKPFVVIIDGLDHVWRDNHKNKTPLDELFNQLIPTHDNVVLVIGTQPVNEAMLPNSLIIECPRNEWDELPAMTGNAIKSYLEYQLKSNRLKQTFHEEIKGEILNESAEALTSITNGYPLHVIYSCEFLISSGKGLSTYAIEQLPPCEDGKIETYYKSIWRTLNGPQKDILHLCCDFKFLWPQDSFSDLLDESPLNTPSVDGVAHLLHDSLSGLRPFHESLIVFVKAVTDHETRINKLLPKVCNWLEYSAPEHINACWLWLCKGRLGDEIPLREGITRTWVLERLSEGYDGSDILRLLERAEHYAFMEFKFDEAYSHRSLKTRLIDGPNFQVEDLSKLKISSLVSAPSCLINELIAMKAEYSPKLLSILAIALWYRDDEYKARKITELALNRHSSELKIYSSRMQKKSRSDDLLLIRASVMTGCFDGAWLHNNENILKWPTEYVNEFIAAVKINGELGLLITLHNKLTEESTKCLIEVATIILSVVEEVDLTAWKEFNNFKHSHLSMLYKAVGKVTPLSISTIYCTGGFHLSPKNSYDEWFYESLLVHLNACGDFCWLPVKIDRERTDVSKNYKQLCIFADMFSEIYIEHGEVTFNDLCFMSTAIEGGTSKDWNIKREDIIFKRAWIRIAANCAVVFSRSKIDSVIFKSALEIDALDIEWFRLWYYESGDHLLTDDAVNLLIEKDIAHQGHTLENTNERACRNVELTTIGLRHADYGSIKWLAKLSWDYTLGYIHHKDMTINDTLEAIEYLADRDLDKAINLLERVSPLVFNVCKFTDGDHTRFALSDIARISAKYNISAIASKYNQEVSDGEWYDADTSLEYFLQYTDLSSTFAKALSFTGLTNDQLKIISSRAGDGDLSAQDIIDELNHSGIDTFINENKKEDVVKDESKLNPADYLPSQFDILLACRPSKEFYLKWYDFWLARGEESELVTHLYTILLKEQLDEENSKYLLDPLFISCRNILGSKRAFNVLVKAQVEMQGWSSWYEASEASLDRLKKVAKHYPIRVNEFLSKTTTLIEPWSKELGDLIIPNKKLVYLLAESRRVDEANSLVLSMICEIEKETYNLPLVQPNWSWEVGESADQQSAKILVSRLAWPVPKIKFQVASQIASLLYDKTHTVNLERLLLAELEKKSLESEVVEILVVFWLAKQKGYETKENIALYIKARSRLSDMILDATLSKIYSYGNYAKKLTPDFNDYVNDFGFKNAQGTEIPLAFQCKLQELEEETGIPFLILYRSEWINSCERIKPRWDNIDYFLNGERNSTINLFTRNSHRGRSAFLNVLNIAENVFGIPRDYSEYDSTLAFPIEPVYVSSIQNKPVWLPEWEFGLNISESNIRKYLGNCITNYNEALDLGALSFPLKIDSDNWIDITIVLAKKTNQSDVDFNILRGDIGFSFGDKLKPDLQFVTKLGSCSKYDNCHPLFGTTHPYTRIGYWQIDLETRGLYIPFTDEQVSAKHNAFKTSFVLDEKQIAESIFWSSVNSLSHPRKIKSLYGTCTLFDHNNNTWLERGLQNMPSIYLCSVSVLTRKHHYEDFNIDEYNFSLDQI